MILWQAYVQDYKLKTSSRQVVLKCILPTVCLLLFDRPVTNWQWIPPVVKHLTLSQVFWPSVVFSILHKSKNTRTSSASYFGSVQCKLIRVRTLNWQSTAGNLKTLLLFSVNLLISDSAFTFGIIRCYFFREHIYYF